MNAADPAGGAAGLVVPPAASAEDWLAAAAARWGPGLILITSFQAEGMVLLDMSQRLGLAVPVWTMDTGRLPEETHAFMAQVESHYGIHIAVAAPAPEEIAALTAARGVNAFYRSPLDRQLCCEIRKSRVLDRLLADSAALAPLLAPRPAGVAAWITGLRRGQSPSRRNVEPIAADPRHPGIWRLAPLAAWTDTDVEEYTRRHGVPRHPLYARGFASIGCAPCTRPAAPGEAPRAGRWWWEQETKKECGLHDAARAAGFDAALAALLHSPTGEPLAS